MPSGPVRYRLRAPASGRESIVTFDGRKSDAVAEDEVGFYDRVTGERMEVVAKLIPVQDLNSALPRAPETVRVCPSCEELVGMDASECPFCRRRMPALGV
jgi:hypothetical protein